MILSPTGSWQFVEILQNGVSQAAFWGASVRNSLIHWDIQLAHRRSPASFVEFQQTASSLFLHCFHALAASDGLFPDRSGQRIP
jgi:hypothetical protein